MQTQTATAEFRIIPLDKIQPSPMNPRKRFEDGSLKELASSIKAHGVRQPILVRANGKKDNFELVVGERRWRASKLAGKTEIPALVDKLSNSEALEIMVIENLQREDVHPLDEALGYEALMRKAADADKDLGDLPGAPRHTAESIAAKVGKSVGYIYARLKLLALIGAAREAFEQNLITPGHAVLVARLQPIDQVRALDACFHSFGSDRELKKLDPAKLKLKDLHLDDEGLLPEKALREWIQDNINLRLKDATWKLDDANLVSAAGPCTTCPKRSVSNPGLFAELAVKGEDTCFDAVCFNEKKRAFVQVTIRADKALANQAEAAGDEPRETLVQLSDLHAYTKPKPDQATYRAGQWLEAKAGSCVNTRQGIFIRGENAGKRKYVCIDQSCKVHKHRLSSASTDFRGDGQGDFAKQQFQNHKRDIANAKKASGRCELAKEIVSGVGSKLHVELLRAYIQENVNTSWEVGARQMLYLMGMKPEKNAVSKLHELVEKGSESVLHKILAAEFLSQADHASDGEERTWLLGLAKSTGVKNAAKILADADAAIAKLKSCRACGCTEQTPCETWKNDKRVRCSLGDDGLCSNPECAKFDPKPKAAKPAVKGKK